MCWAKKFNKFFAEMWRNRWLYALLIPGVLFFAIFKYVPMAGLKIAFMDYNQYNPAASEWVGIAQFVKLFSKRSFFPVLRNTIVISLLKLIIGFPIPVILALMMNEMRNIKFKKVSQTLLYLPHFISWVILSGMIMNLLDPDSGLITKLIEMLTGETIMVLTSKKWFVPMLIITDIYKGMGWGTILYFAAMSGIDPQLYEAAQIDGAGRWKQAIHITLPSIVPTIVIAFIMNCGNILNAGFDQIFMLYSSHVYEVADIIDTYVYRMGIINNDYSFSTAAGMFKSVVALILVLLVNNIAKRTGNGGMIPGYLLMKDLRLIDNRWSLILPGLISAYNVIIMKSNFQSIPDSLEESAKLDGANDVVIFWKIIMPLSKATIATIALFTAVGYWNDYFSSVLYINSKDKWALQAVLRYMLTNTNQAMQSAGVTVTAVSNVTAATIKAASIIVATVPILCVYPFVQKYFVKGVMIGGVKG